MSKSRNDYSDVFISLSSDASIRINTEERLINMVPLSCLISCLVNYIVYSPVINFCNRKVIGGSLMLSMITDDHKIEGSLDINKRC